MRPTVWVEERARAESGAGRSVCVCVCVYVRRDEGYQVIRDRESGCIRKMCAPCEAKLSFTLRNGEILKRRVNLSYLGPSINWV